MSTPTLTTIPIDKIAPSEDNPRGAIDPASEEFAGLCVSIKSVGLLQPILVAAANGDGKHTILDGHRRHAAALEGKLKEIPAMVLADGVSEKIARLSANIQREDFSPVAEARAIKELQGEGLTQLQAADALGKSERWVRERLRLLRMPERTQQAYDDGALPLESMVSIQKVAEASPRVADAIAEAAAEDEGVRSAVIGGRTFEAVNQVIVEAAEEPAEDGSSPLGCMVELSGFQRSHRIEFEQLVLAGAPPERLEAIQESIDYGNGLAKKARYYIGHFDFVFFEGADVDAANSFGCLMSIDGRKYITDAEWLADRFAQHLEGEVKEAEKRLKREKTPDKPEPGSAEEEKAAKEKRRKEREAEQRKREEIRADNLELGQRAERALRSPTLTLEEAKLLALVAIGGNADGLGGGGLIWCYHDYQQEEQLRNGSTKVTYAKGGTAGEDLVSSVLAAKKPEEALGIVLRSLVLTEFADQECVAQSNRSPHSIRWGAAHESVLDLVQAIAMKRDVLPEEVRKSIERRAQLEAERAELHVLKKVGESRAKRGMTRADLEKGVLITEAAVDQAVDAKRLKEHDGEEPSYTITAAGKKRLTHLKKGLKERQAAR